MKKYTVRKGSILDVTLLFAKVWCVLMGVIATVNIFYGNWIV